MIPLPPHANLHRTFAIFERVGDQFGNHQPQRRHSFRWHRECVSIEEDFALSQCFAQITQQRFKIIRCTHRLSFSILIKTLMHARNGQHSSCSRLQLKLYRFIQGHIGLQQQQGIYQVQAILDPMMNFFQIKITFTQLYVLRVDQ
ncbi:hypothetical protein D3C81_1056790 [compost metagenome]